MLDFGLAKPAWAPRCDEPGARAGRRRSGRVADAAARRDRGRRAPRHRRLHEPGAGARRRGRQAHRRVGVRLLPLRVADRRARVRWRERGRDPGRGAQARSRTGRSSTRGAPARLERLVRGCWRRSRAGACATSATPRSRSRICSRDRGEATGALAAGAAGSGPPPRRAATGRSRALAPRRSAAALVAGLAPGSPPVSRCGARRSHHGRTTGAPLHRDGRARRWRGVHSLALSTDGRFWSSAQNRPARRFCSARLDRAGRAAGRHRERRVPVLLARRRVGRVLHRLREPLKKVPPTAARRWYAGRGLMRNWGGSWSDDGYDRLQRRRAAAADCHA